MKKRVVFNVVMFVLIAVLGYILYKQIQEPIAFQAEKDKREKAIISKLMEIRKAQEAYRGVTGRFASSFEQLRDTLRNGRFRIIQVFGDPDDPNNRNVSYDTTFVTAADSIAKLGIDLDALGRMPFGEGKQFEIYADTVTYQQDVVHVVEVGATYADFMGDFASPKYKKYDERYDPKRKIKFGDRAKPILTGSWE